MHRAAQEYPGAVLAVGNAPTALLTIAEKIENGLRPGAGYWCAGGLCERGGKQGAPVCRLCESHGVPAIVAMGRKGGSNVAAAICNALIYSAAEMLDPSGKRMEISRRISPQPGTALFGAKRILGYCYLTAAL